MKFIDKFFTDLITFLNQDSNFLIDTFPDYNYIEIRRIDLCYNQHFETKEEALMYLENQKKLKKEKNYNTKSQTKSFGTTHAQTTSFGSYFKIYHKGSEYSKSDGDLKKHLEINRKFLEKNYKKITSEILKEHEKKIYSKDREF